MEEYKFNGLKKECTDLLAILITKYNMKKFESVYRRVIGMNFEFLTAYADNYFLTTLKNELIKLKK